MNKEKQNLVNLLSKIDQKQKELKQLKKEYKKVFSAISKSWKEQVSSTYPNLQPCGIDEYVGVDIVYEGRTYNIFRPIAHFAGCDHVQIPILTRVSRVSNVSEHKSMVEIAQ